MDVKGSTDVGKGGKVDAGEHVVGVNDERSLCARQHGVG